MENIGKVIEGSPGDIMQNLSMEIIDLLQRGGIVPSGVHALAMLHATIAMIMGGREVGVKDAGEMPSFKMLLSVLTHAMAGSKWTTEEKKEFDAEFCKIVESLGGRKLEPGEPRMKGINLVSGNLGSC